MTVVDDEGDGNDDSDGNDNDDDNDGDSGDDYIDDGDDGVCDYYHDSSLIFEL